MLPIENSLVIFASIKAIRSASIMLKAEGMLFYTSKSQNLSFYSQLPHFIQDIRLKSINIFVHLHSNSASTNLFDCLQSIIRKAQIAHHM